jgi:hypothetical protein
MGTCTENEHATNDKIFLVTSHAPQNDLFDFRLRFSGFIAIIKRCESMSLRGRYGRV